MLTVELRLLASARAARPRLPRAALAAAALLTACSDPASPRGGGLPVGMYVLLSGPFRPGAEVFAETLFVETATTYRSSGLYGVAGAGGGPRYERHPVRDVGFAPDGRPIIAGTSVSGLVEVRRDTLVVYDPGYSQADLIEGGRYVAAAPPPAPGPIASLQVTTTDTAVVHGGRIDIRPFVVRGLDATGRWIPAPSFTVVPPAGWTLDAGVLVAPARDEIGIARLVAGGASVDVRVDAVPDLRATRWSLAWSCADPSVANAPHLGDSATYAMMVDSARYVPTEGPPYPPYPFMDQGAPYSRPWGRAALYAHGVRTLWSGGLATTSAFVRTFNVVSQRADAISIVPPDPDRDASGPPVPGIRLQRTADAARAYVAAAGPAAGGDDHFCRVLSYRHTSPVRLAELP